MIEFSAINKADEFKKVYEMAKKWHTEFAIVYFLASDDRKFTAIASKKVGKAVIRNRAKRVLRAAFANMGYDLKSGFYIIIAKPSILNFSFDSIKKSLRWSFRKMDAFK